MAEEVGVAYVRLVPSMRGFGPEASRAMNDAAAGPAADAGQQAGSRFGGAFQMALAGAGIAAGAVLVQGMAQAIDQGKITARLGAQLGATPAEAEKYGKIAGSLYSKGVTADFQQAADAIRATMSAGLAPPGATNAQLEQISTRAADLANTFEVDLPQATNAAGQLLKTGLAKNAEEAFDVMTRGYQAMGPRADDLADTINEYSVQFKNMGLSAEQATGILAQGMKAGARDTDLVADTIKEFSIEAVAGGERVRGGFQSLGLSSDEMVKKFAAGGPAAAGAFDTVLDKLRGIEDPAKRNAVAIELFGTKAEDMGDALFSLDPSKAVADLGQVAGASDKLGNSLRDNAGAKLTAFTRGLQQGLVDFLGSKVIPALESFAGWMRDNPNVVKGLAVAITGVLVPALVLMAVNATVSAAATVTAWVTSGAAAVGSAATQVAAAGRVVLGWVAMAGQALLAAGRMAASWLIAMGPVGWVIAAIIALGLLIWANWDKIKTWTIAAWDWVWTKIKEVGQGLLDFFLNWTIVGLVIKHWDAIKTKTAAAWNAVVAWVSGIPGKIAGFFMKWTIVGIFLSHWDKIKSGVVTKATNLVAFVAGLPGRIKKGIGSLGSLLYSKGLDIVRGLWNGIKSMGPWLAGQLTSFAKNIIPGPIAKALGIGSPSKLMADEIGHWIPPGIAVGVEDNLGDVTAASQIAAAAALPRGGGQGTRSAVAPAARVVVSGDGLNRALLEWLRQAVRVDGQGSAQALLGQPGR